MEFFLRDYSVNQPTWLYLSSLLIIAVYFRFGRVFSLRNLDLLLMMTISPGVLIIARQPNTALGYTWVVTVTILLLVRIFLDPLIKRRPRFEQNLNAAGLAFLAIAAFGFITTRALTDPIPNSTADTVHKAGAMIEPGKTNGNLKTPPEKSSEKVKPGLTTAILTVPVVEGTKHLVKNNQANKQNGLSTVEWWSARIMAILCHISVIAALYLIGRWQFDDANLGVAMAALYLLLPCTAYKVGELNQVLPAALILWGILMIDRPLRAGIFLAFACGTMFFPVFLVPIWSVYQGRKNWVRFALGFCSVMMILFGVLLATKAVGHSSLESSLQNILGAVNWQVLSFDGGASQTEGIWAWVLHPAYRIPVVAAFIILVILMTIRSRHRSFDRLVRTTTVIVVATQLWYPQQGGIYVIWYLPLMLLIIFRTRIPSTLKNGYRNDTSATESKILAGNG